MNTYSIGDKIIGEYKVLDIFGGKGKSGMGVVYLATSKDFDHPIILKTYQESDSVSVNRFKNEVETWISIGIHPNIVQALFVREINSQLFVGAEYIKKDEEKRNSIADYLTKSEISIYNILQWSAQFCYAMRYALNKGMKVHRDIKPDNLMVDCEGNLKVTDFGLSKSTSYKSNQKLNTNINLTSEGSFLGTLLYASPEQILDSTNIDYRSDIYSFGIVLYQLITIGGYPFSLQGLSTINEIAMMHLQAKVINIEHPLFYIASKCLSRKKENRYNDYDEMLKDIESIANNMDIKLPKEEYVYNKQLKELYVQSLSHEELGNHSKALEIINSYLSIDNSNSSALSLKGRILLILDNLSEALKYTLKSFEINPYNTNTLNNLGIISGRLGKHDDAIFYLKKSIEVDPQNSGAFNNLAIQYQKTDEYEIACHFILKALEITPDKESLRINASNIASIATNYKIIEKPIEIFEHLVSLDPEQSNHWFNLGLCYKLSNRKVKAIACYKKVIQLLPKDEQAYINLIKILAEIGNYQEALTLCENMLDSEISILFAVSFKAQILQAMGKSDEAIRFIKKMIKNNYSNENLWILLSDLYGNISEYKHALTYAEKAKNIILSQGINMNKDNLLYINEKIVLYSKRT